MRIPYLLAAATLLVAGAARTASAQPDPIDVAAVGAWSYTGPTGPAFWATSLGHRECAGPRQSPVDLPVLPLAAPLRLKVNYPRANPGRLLNTGHTVNLTVLNPATLEVADTTFSLEEIHFHVPAEHLMRGRRYAAEIHAVHQLGDGNRAVLTTLVEEGAQNTSWNALINGLPGNRDDERAIGVIDLVAMLGLNGLAWERIYNYAGSLTTPLCSPNVRFLIREQAITLSRQQIDALASTFARNVRPTFQVTTPVTLHSVAP
jgi:carbonic anhydrase